MMTFKRKNVYCLYCVVLLIIFYTEPSIGLSSDSDRKNDFDYLSFTQSWPITLCINWMTINDENACNLPKRRDSWTIHGIWPSRSATFGPEFCANDIKIQLNTMELTVQRLRQNWPNIYKGSREETFWKYQWDKHGKCAATKIQELNTPIKYFEQGLIWHEQYPMHKILSTANIQPGQAFDAIEIHNAIKNELNVNAVINCLKDKQNDEQYLFEIQLCFNKNLELTDCIRRPNANGVRTNCNSKKKIQYPKKLPDYLVDGGSDDESTAWRFVIHFISIILIVVLVFFAYKSAKSRYKF